MKVLYWISAIAVAGIMIFVIQNGLENTSTEPKKESSDSVAVKVTEVPEDVIEVDAHSKTVDLEPSKIEHESKELTETEKIDQMIEEIVTDKVIATPQQKPVEKKTVISRVEGLWKTADGKEPSYRQRKKVLAKMGLNLKLEERKELYKFLRHGPTTRASLHIKDLIMIKLEKQGEKVPEYISELNAIAADKTVDGDMRGYAVQHLRSAYRNTDENNREEIRQTFYNGLEDTSSDVSGTSLLALVNLQKRHGNLEEKKMIEAAHRLSTDESVHLPSRITAMQLSGVLGVKSVLPEARKNAKNGADTVMKIASIAALGDLGEEEDLEFLNEIIKNRSKRVFHESAKLAFHKIKNRLGL